MAYLCSQPYTTHWITWGIYWSFEYTPKILFLKKLPRWFQQLNFKNIILYLPLTNYPTLLITFQLIHYTPVILAFFLFLKYKTFFFFNLPKFFFLCIFCIHVLIKYYFLWSLILCVSLAGTQFAQMLLFWILLWRCLQMKFTFKSVDSEKIILPTIVWVGLVQSVEGLKRETELPLREREEIVSRLPWTWTGTSALPWVSNQLACLANFGLGSPHNCVSQPLKINIATLSPSLSDRDTHMHTHTNTHPFGSVSLDTPV